MAAAALSLPNAALMTMNDREAIEMYFRRGHQYKVILLFLTLYNKINMSIRTLKRRITSYGLSRRAVSPIGSIWDAINQELQGPSRVGGYRSIWRTLRVKYNINASQEVVREMLRQIDPVSVDNRHHHRLQRRTYSSRGPNHCWHIDGYDKLTPYELCISGCIDGYSRRILWLNCGYTNHDPTVIGGFFLDAVEKYGGFPAVVRTDCGTENVTVASIQGFVFPNARSHVYGTSPGNQRIEAWWSFYRRNRSQWWIELFEDLITSNSFHPGNKKDTEILRFCFMDVFQNDLNEVAAMWNMHRIRPSRVACCPPGIPDELYFLPSAGAVDCKNLLPLQNLPAFLVQQTRRTISHCEDPLYEDYLNFVCQLHTWQLSTDVGGCLGLYFNLIAVIP